MSKAHKYIHRAKRSKTITIREIQDIWDGIAANPGRGDEMALFAKTYVPKLLEIADLADQLQRRVFCDLSDRLDCLGEERYD